MMIIKKPLQYATVIDRQGDCGVFDTMNDAIRLASIACEEFSKYSLSRKNEILNSVVKTLEEHLEELTLAACKEAQINSFDDAIYKNNAVLNNYKNNNYLEARLDADEKLNNCGESSTVNGIIVSPSNSIETLIRNSILMLKAGNAVVFSSNKNFKKVFAQAIKLINKGIEAADGPKNLVVTVKEPNDENTKIMIEHENITLISEGNNNNSGNIAI